MNTPCEAELSPTGYITFYVYGNNYTHHLSENLLGVDSFVLSVNHTDTNHISTSFGICGQSQPSVAATEAGKTIFEVSNGNTMSSSRWETAMHLNLE